MLIGYRPATIGDAGFISQVVVASWRDAYRDFLPLSLLASLDQSPHHNRASWERQLGEPASAAWIIHDHADDGVGVLRLTIGASSIPGTDTELTAQYLLSHARGQGLGSAALAHARAEASSQNAPVLGLCVLAGNTRGNRFYQQRGARRLSERIAFRVGAEPIVEIMYRLG
jgi:GNAT superfamily N-acetyltransferase